MSIPTLITFVAYFIVLLGIGLCFYRRSESIEDYLLGGRGMGSWVTALSEDFYCKAIKKQASEREIVLVGRACVVVISIVALIMAMDRDNTILGIVSYAWGGFGAAFGPLVLFALFSRKTSWQSALAGMVIGTVVLVLWKQVGLSGTMYEIVPGFAANCLTILVVNLLIGQEDERVLQEFDDVVRTARFT